MAAPPARTLPPVGPAAAEGALTACAIATRRACAAAARSPWLAQRVPHDQQAGCWSCGTRWASEQAPPLRLIRGGGDPDAVRMVDLPLDVAVAVALPVPVVVR